ncbi:unnamed protein product [Adineta ricciae]|uniref:Uncharacterized protein n=1 Tax=Adineta ricciae TaxID=249248 RepID=A0A816BBH6_ADIRI|nr:unnamed protein product [Adineta ricciae]CAF1606907.1 unnamed protein product [Adineta ricciae]
MEFSTKTKQEYLNIIADQVANWNRADVRTVPGVMIQVCVGQNKHDNTIEHQINYFMDCAETYVHNHRHAFSTYGLQGEYKEKIWEIVDDKNGDIVYKFPRLTGNVFDSPIVVPGTLRHVKSRHHFPGNEMHVPTHQFHSIVPTPNSSDRVLTFLTKAHTVSSDMFVLSTSAEIEARKDAIRPATEEERQSVLEKLEQVLAAPHRYGF